MDGPALPARTVQDCPAWDSSVAASCGKPAMLESGHFLSVLAADWAALQEVSGSPLDPDHHVAREIIGNIFVLPVEMFNDKGFVLFHDVSEGWSLMLIYSPRNVHPSSRKGVSPVSKDERSHGCDLYLLGDQP